MVQSQNRDLTNMSTTIIDVDDTYQIEPHVDIFALIHSSFNVVGGITVTEISNIYSEQNS